MLREALYKWINTIQYNVLDKDLHTALLDVSLAEVLSQTQQGNRIYYLAS